MSMSSSTARRSSSAVEGGPSGRVARAAPSHEGAASDSFSRGGSLKISNVSFSVGGITILDDVSFEVKAGELFGIIGPNGAGKSSLFNCISGIYLPTEGQIHLSDKPIVGRRPTAVAKLGVARTFQNLALFNNLNVSDNLMLGRHRLMRTGYLTAALWFGRARREEVKHRLECAEIIELLGLSEVAKLPVGVLPYGAQKRVELGRALVSEPNLLLLDEPVAGMNDDETEQMSNLLRNVSQQLGITIVLVEHDVHMVQQLADRVCAINFGQVVVVGSPAEVVTHPTVIEAYLGADWS